MVLLNGIDDDSELANRRSSGRTRKLTARGQALVGSKYLPVASAKNALDEVVSPTDSNISDNSFEKPKTYRRSSTTKVQASHVSDLTSPPPTPDSPSKLGPVSKDDVKADPVVFEQPDRRALRRDRKPSARFLEATAEPLIVDTVEEPNRRASRRDRKSTAKALEAQDTSDPRKRSTSLSETSPHAELEPRAASAKLLVSPDAEVQVSTTSSKTRRRQSSPKRQPEVTPLKRSASPTKNAPQPKSPRLSLKISTRTTNPGSSTASESEQLAKKTQQDASAVKPAKASLKPLRRPSSLRFEVSTLDDEAKTSYHKVALNDFNEKLDQRNSASRPQGILIDGKLFRPTKLVIMRRPKSSSSSKKQNTASPSIARKLHSSSKSPDSMYKQPKSTLQSPMPDATPIRFSPFVPVTPQAKTGCNLFCLSPSSRILAFAQIAAESTDSDDEEDDEDAAMVGSKSSSSGLYEKWMAIGRERFCVCNKPGHSHAHPTAPSTPTTELQKAVMPNGVSESPPADPALPTLSPGKTMPIPLPPLNSVMPATQGRKVSALYSAMADSPRESRPSRPSSNSDALSAHQKHAKMMSYEQRMSEDFRALEAIRHQAKMEGVSITHDMTYGQIKQRLDQHRTKASYGFAHADGSSKGKGKVIQI